MRLFLLRMLYGLECIAHGLLYMLTIGRIHTNWPLDVSIMLARAQYGEKWSINDSINRMS